MALTDSNITRTLLLIKTTTGKIKISGMYQIDTDVDTPHMQVFNGNVLDICGLEFDSVEYITQHPPYNKTPLGSYPGLRAVNYLEYTT